MVGVAVYSGIAAALALAADIAFDGAPFLDVGVMVFQRLCEDVSAVAVSDEVELLRLGGVQDGFVAARPGLQIGVGGRPSIWYVLCAVFC